MTARLVTASWTALWQASKGGPLPLQPVRISRGTPKFWPQAATFPAVDELIPDGWMLSEKDLGKSERGYRGKLDRIGLERITARLDEIAAECGATLALACFEDLSKPGEQCHRRWFADWFANQPGGLVVPEIGTEHGDGKEQL